MLFGYTQKGSSVFYSIALGIILKYISHLQTVYIQVVCKILFINIFSKQALGVFVLILGFALILCIVSHLDLE